MNDRNWGGRREGAGRKATGRKTKNITLTLKNEEADLLKKMAQSRNLTISDFISETLFLNRDEK